MPDTVRTLDGLDGTVVIHRDTFGIPHARATSPHDAFFAQGFVQAADRIGQLECDRRRAHGRWAEVAGRGALGLDVFARRADLTGAARREYDHLDPSSQAVLGAYAAGVNAWLSVGDPLPLDLRLAGLNPEPWQPWDCCAVFLGRHVTFAGWQRKLWRGRLAGILGGDAAARLERRDGAAIPLIVPPGATGQAPPADPAALDTVRAAMAGLVDVAGGSNAWALSGARTASGRPLLAGDPHRLIEAPNVYYQCHLACPDFDAVGLAFVGVPGFPHFGHNEHVAWCVTNANADYQDLYVEALDASLVTRQEQIAVRGEEPVTVECRTTRHGPVLFAESEHGVGLALATTALARPSRGLSVLAPMLRARNVDELDGAMRAWVDPVNNLVSADVAGHIRYRTVGEVPVRAAANAWGPVPGDTDAHDWTGTVPFDELPTVRDPDRGYLVTANQRIVGADYPHYLSVDYSRPDRARRLTDRVAACTDATVDDMAAIHRDRRALGADLWVDRLTPLTGRDDHETAALELLRSWDRVMDAASPAAAVYLVTRDSVGRAVAHHPALAPLRVPMPGEPTALYVPLELRLWTLLPALLAADDAALLPDGATWPEVLAAGLTDAVGLLRGALGDDPSGWRWGALHQCAPRHPLSATNPAWADQLDPPAVELGGEWDTVWSSAHPAGYGFGVTTASVARYVFDLADWDRSAWVVPLGASGEPTSSHFADQQPHWAAGTLVPMHYAWDQVAAAAESTTRLEPASTA